MCVFSVCECADRKSEVGFQGPEQGGLAGERDPQTGRRRCQDLRRQEISEADERRRRRRQRGPRFRSTGTH